MAAMTAARRTAVSKLVEKLIASTNPRPVAASTSRSFSTGALERRRYSSAAASWCRAVHEFPSIQDMFYPFSTAQSLNRMLSMMDQMFDSPFFGPVPAPAEVPRATAGELLRGLEAKEDNDALHLRIDMPGLGKEHVKVWAEKNTLVIKGEGEVEKEVIKGEGEVEKEVIKGEGEKEPGKKGEESVAGRRYSSRIVLPLESYRMDQIKAEMKNGVLKVVVPKIKQDDRNDVFQVNIE